MVLRSLKEASGEVEEVRKNHLGHFLQKNQDSPRLQSEEKCLPVASLPLFAMFQTEAEVSKSGILLIQPMKMASRLDFMVFELKTIS